jgi:YHS domain-containing protein
MIRAVLYALLTIFLITFLRLVVGIITKAFGDLFVGESDPQKQARPKTARGSETRGELKKDPVCGTYVATSTSVQKTIRGEVVHFCSESCRDKYSG